MSDKKIEIEIDKRIPPGIMFSVVSTASMTSGEVYSLAPQNARKFDVWSPVDDGHVPGYEAALFLRLLAALRTSLSGREDKVIGDSWDDCISCTARDSTQPLCIVHADMLHKVAETLAGVAALGVSGFFLKDLLYILHVASGKAKVYLRELLAVHTRSIIKLEDYLRDVKVNDVPLVEKKDSADAVMYKLDRFIEICTSSHDYKSPPFMSNIRYRATSSGLEAQLKGNGTDPDAQPVCRFAVPGFDTVPVIISEADEDDVIANLPMEFVNAVTPLIEGEESECATRLQCMVRLAQSLFMHIPRILVSSLEDYPELRYGVHVCHGSQRLLPSSLDCEFMHDIFPQKLI